MRIVLTYSLYVNRSYICFMRNSRPRMPGDVEKIYIFYAITLFLMVNMPLFARVHILTFNIILNYVFIFWYNILCEWMLLSDRKIRPILPT